MSPTQTSGLDSFGWRLRCPFSLSAALQAGAEDSYGIEDGSSSKSSNSSKGEGHRARRSRPPKPTAKAAPAKAAPAKVSAKARRQPALPAKAAAKPAHRQGAGQQCRGDQGGRHQGRRQGRGAAAGRQPADKDAETTDSPLLDLSDAAVRKMIKNAKKRGYVTYEQLNGVLPSEEVTSEQIEDVLAMLNEMGINVVESEEAERGRGGRGRGRR